jgi:hypothetical protein
MFSTSAYPKAISVFENKSVDLIPVDVAAGAITEILTQKEITSKGRYEVYNIVNPHSIPWSALVEMLQYSKLVAGEGRMEEITVEERVKRLNLAAESWKEVPRLKIAAIL